MHLSIKSHRFVARLLFALCVATSGPLLAGAEPAGERPPAPLDDTMVDFLRQSMHVRLAVIEAGRLAHDRAGAESVGAYAKRLVGEESLLLSRLQGLATATGVPLPDQTSEKYAARLEKLRSAPAPKFERAFWDFVTDIYEADLVAYEFASKAEDPEVRQFAVQYRSMFERQLAEIEELQEAQAG